jgi:fumarate reductase flavoprotein subunit
MSGFFRKILIISFCTAVILAAGLANARTRTYTTDVVVIGVGGSGVSAAVSAAENGAKVIAIEKQDIPGGSSNFAEGLFAVDTEEQRKEFIDLTAEEAFKKSMEVNQSYRVNPSMVRMYLKESTSTISWLKGHGVGFEVFRMSAEEPKVWHLVQDYKQAHHGAALITRMVEEAEKLGVKIMYGTPGTKLIYDNGVVKGVEAVDARGNKIVINSKAVIIATGGFPDSKEFIEKYTPYDPEKVAPFVPLGKTGDGINMAMEAGADTEGFGLMVHPGIKDNGIPPIGNLVAMSWEPLLWVNKYGKRFTDETVVHNFSWAGNAIEAQRDSYIWSVFDENEIKYVETKGTRTGVGVLMPVRSRLAGLRKEIKDAIESGSTKVVKASSIEELAKKIDVPVANLSKAVKDYNRIAEYNIDPEFARDADTVHPIVAPNYYAIKVQPYFFVSLGGVRTNTKLEVTDKQDEVIKGLYAAGCDVGGVYGSTYTLWASGSAYSFAATSGRLSGKNAAEYVKSN